MYCPMKRKRSYTTEPKRPSKKPRLFKQPSLINPPARKTSSIEKKNFDALTTATIVAAQTTAVVAQIFTPDQGVGPTEHQGRACQVKSLSYRWYGSFAATSAGASPIRMLIVYDKQANAATPATTTIVASDAITTHMNLSNNRRFIVVCDEVTHIGSAGPQSWCITGYRKINLPTEFNDVNGGTIADITTGSFIALFWQNGNVITANPTSALFSRFRFIDQ